MIQNSSGKATSPYFSTGRIPKLMSYCRATLCGWLNMDGFKWLYVLFDQFCDGVFICFPIKFYLFLSANKKKLVLYSLFSIAFNLYNLLAPHNKKTKRANYLVVVVVMVIICEILPILIRSNSLLSISYQHAQSIL